MAYFDISYFHLFGVLTGSEVRTGTRNVSEPISKSGRSVAHEAIDSDKLLKCHFVISTNEIKVIFCFFFINLFY